jgi:hypothetical protein
MTDNQLAKIDIYPDKTAVHKHRYWCNITQEHMIIHRDMTLKDVVENIFATGVSQGVEDGKLQRSNQFKMLLNNSEQIRS